MSPVLAPEPPLTLRDPGRAHETGAHSRTLEDMVTGAWGALLRGTSTDCLACGAELHPRHSAGAGIVGGRCEGCGGKLA